MEEIYTISVMEFPYEIYDNYMGCWLDTNYYTIEAAEDYINNTVEKFDRFIIYRRVS